MSGAPEDFDKDPWEGEVDEYGNEERTSASDETYTDYINEAEEILSELGIFQEEH